MKRISHPGVAACRVGHGSVDWDDGSKSAETDMEGRVLWYKPGSETGCLRGDSGRRFLFRTRGDGDAIHGGARVVFKVAEMDGNLVGVSVRVVQTCLDILLRENDHLARKFQEVVTIETPPRTFPPAPDRDLRTPPALMS